MLHEIINVLIENGLEVIIAIISIITSYYVIPAIRNDLIPFLQEKRLLSTIKSMVEGVEKMAEAGIIPKVEKKAKVIELLNAKGIKVSAEVDVLIEACVKELDLITDVLVEEVKDAE